MIVIRGYIDSTFSTHGYGGYLEESQIPKFITAQFRCKAAISEFVISTGEIKSTLLSPVINAQLNNAKAILQGKFAGIDMQLLELGIADVVCRVTKASTITGMTVASTAINLVPITNNTNIVFKQPEVTATFNKPNIRFNFNYKG